MFRPRLSRCVAAVLLCLVLPVAGQTNDASEPVPREQTAEQQEAERALLEGIGRNLQRADIVRADFEETKHVAGMANPLRSRGSFIYAKAVGVYWHTREPFDSAAIITPDRLVMKEDGVVKRTLDFKQEPQIGLFNEAISAALAGETDKLEREFRVHAGGDPARWTLDLTPRQERIRKAFTRLSLSGSDVIEHITLYTSIGPSTDIVLTNITHSIPPITDDERALFDL